MRNLIAVVFLEPVTEGMEFPREDWPLHITLVKFDVVKSGIAKPDAEASEASEAVKSDVDQGPRPEGGRSAGPAADPFAATVAALMDVPVRAALGRTLTVGGKAGFGRGGSIPVSLIEPDAGLQRLHDALVGMVEALPGRISSPGYTRAGYRPHVSHRGDKVPRAGEQLLLDRVALVDMAPDGGHASRRVLRLWTATP